MGKRLPKPALLEESRVERAALDDALAQLSPREMTCAGVTPGGWSVKDILGHLVEWQHMKHIRRWMRSSSRGERR